MFELFPLFYLQILDTNLQHRRVEHTNYGGTQHVITNVLGDQHQVELPKPGETESTNRVAKIIMPPMHIYMAGTILGLNCIFPGSGKTLPKIERECECLRVADRQFPIFCIFHDVSLDDIVKDWDFY